MAERIRLFAEHHIVAVRTGRRNGEIIAVKHATFGWISPQVFYSLQKIHDLIPVAGPFIAGAYQMKWAIASSQIELAGIGLPVGGSFYGAAIYMAMSVQPELLGVSPVGNVGGAVQGAIGTAEYARAARDFASLLLAGVFLPFGEILLIWAYTRIIGGLPVSWKALLDSFLPEVTALSERIGPPHPQHNGGRH